MALLAAAILVVLTVSSFQVPSIFILIFILVDFNKIYNTFTKGSPYEGHGRHSGE